MDVRACACVCVCVCVRARACVCVLSFQKIQAFVSHELLTWSSWNLLCIESKRGPFFDIISYKLSHRLNFHNLQFL